MCRVGQPPWHCKDEEMCAERGSSCLTHGSLNTLLSSKNVYRRGCVNREFHITSWEEIFTDWLAVSSSLLSPLTPWELGLAMAGRLILWVVPLKRWFYACYRFLRINLSWVFIVSRPCRPSIRHPWETEFRKVNKTFLFAVTDTQRLNLAFRFDIREISEIDDRRQYLSVPMYFSVAWLESRLWINETATAWDETVTGPQNVRMAAT